MHGGKKRQKPQDVCKRMNKIFDKVVLFKQYSKNYIFSQSMLFLYPHESQKLLFFCFNNIVDVYSMKSIEINNS